jgi:hypothetical protein
MRMQLTASCSVPVVSGHASCVLRDVKKRAKESASKQLLACSNGCRADKRKIHFALVRSNTGYIQRFQGSCTQEIKVMKFYLFSVEATYSKCQARSRSNYH